jgi:hypothetical protein
MVRDPACQTDPVVPAVGGVEIDFFTQPPLRTNVGEIADEKYPNHQARIDCRTLRGDVILGHDLTHECAIQELVDLPKQVTRGNPITPVERGERRALVGS